MIVVDENLHDHRIIEAISAWYTGRVVSVTTLRPGSIIKDEAVPALLLKASQPTCVTINVTDFWKSVESHKAYCIVTVALPTERTTEIPMLLRRFFRMPEFKSKVLRMGKVVRLTSERIEYYQLAHNIQTLPLI